MTDDERRTKEMGVRVVLFNDRHADADAGYIVLAERLKSLVGQMDGEETLQRSALMDRHTSAVDKERILGESAAAEPAEGAGADQVVGRTEPPSREPDSRRRFGVRVMRRSDARDRARPWDRASPQRGPRSRSAA